MVLPNFALSRDGSPVVGGTRKTLVKPRYEIKAVEREKPKHRPLPPAPPAPPAPTDGGATNRRRRRSGRRIHFGSSLTTKVHEIDCHKDYPLWYTSKDLQRIDYENKKLRVRCRRQSLDDYRDDYRDDANNKDHDYCCSYYNDDDDDDEEEEEEEDCRRGLEDFLSMRAKMRTQTMVVRVKQAVLDAQHRFGFNATEIIAQASRKESESSAREAIHRAKLDASPCCATTHMGRRACSAPALTKPLYHNNKTLSSSSSSSSSTTTTTTTSKNGLLSSQYSSGSGNNRNRGFHMLNCSLQQQQRSLTVVAASLVLDRPLPTRKMELEACTLAFVQEAMRVASGDPKQS